MQTDTVIIGSGITGLTTAFYLKEAGKDFVVLEQADRCGGVINTVTKNGFTFELGPNTGIIGNETVVDLFSKLNNCTIETPVKTAKKRFILKNGNWHAMPTGLISAIKTPLYTFGDKLRILGEPFRKPGIVPDESIASFVKRRMGNSFLDYAIDPFIKGVYAGDPNKLIVRYAFPKLYELEQTYGSLIGGSVKKQFAKKTDAQKQVSHKTFSAHGGLSSITDALFESIGKEHFMFDSHYTQITPHEQGFTVTTHKNDEKIEIFAKHVISTVGAYELEPLLSFIDKGVLKDITSLTYAPVIETALGFNQWNGCDTNGFGGLIPSVEDRNVLGILYMSSLFSGRSPQSGLLCNVFMGGVKAAHMIEMNEYAIMQTIENEFKRTMLCKSFNPELVQITKHPKAIPQYGIETGVRLSAVAAIEKRYKGMVIGGNLRDGIGLADRIKQGKALALQVME